MVSSSVTDKCELELLPCLDQVQRVAFGVVLNSQLQALAALFMNTARASDHSCALFAVNLDN